MTRRPRHHPFRPAMAMVGLTTAMLVSACGSGGSTAAPATSPAGSAASSPTVAAGTAETSAASVSSSTGSSAASPDATGAAPSSTGGSTSPAAGAAGDVQFREAEAGSGAGKKIGLISLGDSLVPFSKLVTDSVTAQAEAAGAELVVCDSGLDGAKALECAQNFKTQGVQGYLNFQVDANVAAAICAAGPQVPVIAIDIQQQPCQQSFMGANNEQAGYLAGKAMGEAIQEQFDCQYDAYVSLEQPAAGAVNEARMNGYRTGFSEVCGEISNERVVDGGGALDSARTAFVDVLTALPGAKVVVVTAINDDSILGALSAARTAGRPTDVFVSGQGADPSSWCEILNNPNWIADSAYFPERYGEIGVPYLLEALDGAEIPADLLVPHEVVNADNLESFYPDARSGC